MALPKNPNEADSPRLTLAHVTPILLLSTQVYLMGIVVMVSTTKICSRNLYFASLVPILWCYLGEGGT